MKVDEREVYRVIRGHLPDFDNYLLAVGRYRKAEVLRTRAGNWRELATNDNVLPLQAIRQPGTPLFNTGAPGFLQEKLVESAA